MTVNSVCVNLQFDNIFTMSGIGFKGASEYSACVCRRAIFVILKKVARMVDPSENNYCRYDGHMPFSEDFSEVPLR